MRWSPDVEERVDTYLDRFRRGLRDATPDERREFTEELRSHIADRLAASGDVTVSATDQVLRALGTADELAMQYRTDVFLARAHTGRTRRQSLPRIFSWADLSASGAFVLLGSFAGYGLAGAFVACALLKPLHPHAAGLWLVPGAGGDMTISFRMGFGGVPAASRDLLGWWIVPLGLLMGAGVVRVTTRCALLCARVIRAATLDVAEQ